MTRTHSNIKELDGSASLIDDFDKDDNHINLIQYWKDGKLGHVYPTFLYELIATEKAKDVKIEET